MFMCECRNFPQGTISDMVNDTCQGISFVINNIASYGGDPDRWHATTIHDSFSSYLYTLRLIFFLFIDNYVIGFT